MEMYFNISQSNFVFLRLVFRTVLNMSQIKPFFVYLLFNDVLFMLIAIRIDLFFESMQQGRK